MHDPARDKGHGLADLTLTDKQQRELTDLARSCLEGPLPADLPEQVRSRFGVDLSADYPPLSMPTPLMVAPGQMSLRPEHIRRAVSAGFGGVVLKSHVGESASGLCSMTWMRRRPTTIRTFYEEADTAGQRPIIHWNGRGDTRSWAEYEPFAREAVRIAADSPVALVGSFLCHLPQLEEGWIEEEWVLAGRRHAELGLCAVEIDFCPYIECEGEGARRETVLRWYRGATELIHRGAPGLAVYPKLLSLPWGVPFSVEMARAAVDGGAAGLVCSNRIYKPRYESGHGGCELFERNLAAMRAIRGAGMGCPIVGTGGIYTGVELLAYILAGASCGQVMSILMGRFATPLPRRGDRFAAVNWRILLDPAHGLVAALLDGANRGRPSSVRGLVGADL